MRFRYTGRLLFISRVNDFFALRRYRMLWCLACLVAVAISLLQSAHAQSSHEVAEKCLAVICCLGLGNVALSAQMIKLGVGPGTGVLG